MKILKTILATSIFVMVVASCGNNTPVAVETTITTINYGTDCNRTVSTEIVRLTNLVKETRSYTNSDLYVPTRSQYVAIVSSLEDLRSYIRSLNIPLVLTEQTIYVNVIDQYLDALNLYWESGKRDLSVNNYKRDLLDAGTDFGNAFTTLCTIRS
jgi:hypothetical protein